MAKHVWNLFFGGSSNLGLLGLKIASLKTSTFGVSTLPLLLLGIGAYYFEISGLMDGRDIASSGFHAHAKLSGDIGGNSWSLPSPPSPFIRIIQVVVGSIHLLSFVWLDGGGQFSVKWIWMTLMP